jgi:hypothetical protein
MNKAQRKRGPDDSRLRFALAGALALDTCNASKHEWGKRTPRSGGAVIPFLLQRKIIVLKDTTGESP